MTRPQVDASMSESGDYGEPSSSTVVLPEPPAWLNIDVIISYDERQRIKDVIEEGRELIPQVAEWARRARSVRDALDLSFIVWELEELQQCIGISALNDVAWLLGLIGGDPAGTPGRELAERLGKAYPEYRDLIDAHFA